MCECICVCMTVSAILIGADDYSCECSSVYMRKYVRMTVCACKCERWCVHACDCE